MTTMEEKSMVVVFVHGFMGSSKSFMTFPQDISATLNAEVLFYEYETRGEYELKIKNLVEFLSNVTHPRVFILSHSMGGPLSIDACLKIDKPNIKGIISFDSPFFGLDPTITKAGVNRAQDAIKSVSSYIPSSNGWGMLAMGIGAAAALLATTQPQVKESVRCSNVRFRIASKPIQMSGWIVSNSWDRYGIFLLTMLGLIFSRGPHFIFTVYIFSYMTAIVSLFLLLQSLHLISVCRKWLQKM
jgi:pimeloyl-ACP methyl ester carboxylesterase